MSDAIATGTRSTSTAVACDGRRQPVLDERVVHSLVADFGDAAFVWETVRLYLAELDERLAGVRRAESHGSAQELATAAHTLKSPSALLGLSRLADKCRIVEHAARRGRIDAAAAELVQAEADDARAALTGFLTRASL